MTKKLLFIVLACCVALLIASCSEDKKTESAAGVTASTDVALSSAATEGDSLRAAFLDMLVDTLGLTGEQEERFRAILESYRLKREELRASIDSGTTREEIHAQMEALRTAMLEELKAILTEEQLALFESIRPPHPRGPRGKGGPHGPRDRPQGTPEEHRERMVAKLTEDLNLTTHQQEQLRAIVAQIDSAMRANHPDGPPDMPPPDGAPLMGEPGAPPPDSLCDSTGTMRPPHGPGGQVIEALKAILTDEQLAKLEEMKAQRDAMRPRRPAGR